MRTWSRKNDYHSLSSDGLKRFAVWYKTRYHSQVENKREGKDYQAYVCFSSFICHLPTHWLLPVTTVQVISLPLHRLRLSLSLICTWRYCLSFLSSFTAKLTCPVFRLGSILFSANLPTCPELPPSGSGTAALVPQARVLLPSGYRTPVTLLASGLLLTPKWGSPLEQNPHKAHSFFS